MRIFPVTLALAALVPMCAPAQQTDDTANPAITAETPPAHVLWIVPNFRTAPLPEPYAAIAPKEKFRIAAQDIFDRGTITLAIIFAAQGQLTNSNRSFGQGAEGSAHYFATSYADMAMGNAMTEGIFPTLLHEDPRDFRRGAGSIRARLRYAVGQIFLTYTDTGKRQFNCSEFGGNAVAVAISQSWYPDNRRASDAASKFALQIAIDTATNLMKEFWPDRHRKPTPEKRQSPPASYYCVINRTGWSSLLSCGPIVYRPLCCRRQSTSGGYQPWLPTPAQDAHPAPQLVLTGFMTH